ncbi:P-loop containing nucleoside triphosphate hydrolase protein [Gymnopilus junonius]|uniref:P-loop containing nucleoside triphosphate hydrolase protein n=1 Tax=Gymnopilus junonius TaxID=109634 RepID=A0A9P5TT43_GYMJU|nr:P-loop containing nucleoside triphosphate hydrolase protein [Gymnopilus junonius]
MSNQSHAGVGLSNPQLSHGRRKMLDLVNKLHSTGVQVDIDLPQIAVIGSQSAGKSSLIESISGITLPRAAGTCTRCPTECRLSRNNSSWQCIVSLRFITDSNGQPLGQARNERFGPIIYDKSEVEERIRRAQRAILNPTRSAKFFLESDDEDAQLESQLSFSLNSVTLQISGPDVADLSFCDLPGLIASVSGSRGGGNDIALVESLVTTYIKKPSCIILLTVACETDFENQGAHRLAKQYDPEGKRTIGVLTKPDRIPLGEESNWLPFIKNEKEPLENNWFCVKQPSSSDLKANITWSQARQMENDFFSSKAPWCELESIYQKYLRTSNLVERLSSVLSDLIGKRLPQIQDELERSIIATRTLLDQLPRAPSSDSRSEISTLLHHFTSDLLSHVQGVPDDAESTFGSGIGLIQAIRPAQERFKKAIRDTAPKFKPFKQNDAGKKHLSRPGFLRSEEGDEEESVTSESETDDDAPFSGGQTMRKRKEPGDDNIYVDEVLDRAHRARTRELPGHYPFVVQKSFIDYVIKQWQAPALVLCKTVHSTIMEHVKALVKKHFGEFGQGILEQRVRSILQQHLKHCLERAEERVNWLIQVEDIPFSLNTHYLANYRSKFLVHFRAAREKYERADIIKAIKEYTSSPSVVTTTTTSSTSRKGVESTYTSQPTGVAKVLAGLAEMGMSGVTAHDLPKLLPPDPMEPALTIMADVRAYFQVAYKRFADNVPLAIDFELVRGVERDVLMGLYASLGVNGVNGQRICEELAQESVQVADKRADLKKKLERLEGASGELLTVGLAG